VKILPALLTGACGGALMLLAGVPMPGQGQDSEHLQQQLHSLRSSYSAIREAWQAERGARLEQAAAQESWRAEQAAFAVRLSELKLAQQQIAARTDEFAPAASEIDRLRQEFAKVVARNGQRADQFEESLAEHRAELSSSLAGVESLQADVRATAAALATYPAREQHALRTDVLSPVFQLSGGDAVGSAVLIAEDDDESGHHYLALSCYHVVRDILETRPDVDDLAEEHFQALFTDVDGSERSYSARMIHWDVPSDLALLRIETNAELGPMARIAPLARMNQIGVFSEVYTVGCPLGTAAQATSGEITREHWQVDDEPYWMVSSPAYFGNSGGGVFSGESHELIGIFAKIYTHGTYRPQVITHMGLAIPLVRIHSWLTEIGYASILPSAEAKVQEAAAAPQ